METLLTIDPELLSLSQVQMSALMPFFWITVGIILAIILCVIKFINPKPLVFIVSVLAALVAAWSSFSLLAEGPVIIFNNMMVVDSFSNFMNLIFLFSAVATVFASYKYLDLQKIQHLEYYILVLLSTLGMMLMVSSLDLIVLFIALEFMSLMVYTLVGFRRADRKSNESAVKYFIMGGAASALLLYGVALLYGATGTTNIVRILDYVQIEAFSHLPLFAVGSVLVIVGFMFKVASVPFHMWMPDVYEGAPTPVTGFMTTGLKAAAFAAFLRVFISLGYGQGLVQSIETNIHNVLWISAVLTMLLGNVVALTQTNLKRMLAYSSIAHTGYILIGFLSGSGHTYGYTPLLIYLASYAIMNLGAFVILTVLSKENDSGVNLHNVSGLSQTNPWLSFSMAVFLLSMAGLPPTVGFIAKYMLFYSAIEAGEIWLVVLAVLCSAVSVYYYLRVLVYMYMKDAFEEKGAVRVPFLSATAVCLLVLLTLQLGILPSKIVEAAKIAISSL